MPDFNKSYDEFFIKANEEFFGGVFDWRWWKAQGIAESNLKPTAVSRCGAKGVMQFMPKTWDEISKQLGVIDIYNPESNIRAGVFYMKKLWRYWNIRRIRDFKTCLQFCQASYNAGMGNIRKAWIKTGEDNWAAVAAQLPEIAGEKNSLQTIKYIDRVASVFDILQDMATNDN